MDKAKIVERRDNLVRNREQMVANVNMLQGMIEEANFWIKNLEAEEAAEDAQDEADDAAMEAEYGSDTEDTPEAVEAEAEAEEAEVVRREEIVGG